MFRFLRFSSDLKSDLRSFVFGNARAQFVPICSDFFRFLPICFQNKSWPRGSTGVKRYGCIPRSAANKLGRIPKILGAQNPYFKEFLWGGNTLGLVPASLPSHFGMRLYFVRPHSPSPKNQNRSGKPLSADPICKSRNDGGSF